MNLSPEQILKEYNAAQLYKDSIGSKGIKEQSEINERFFVGDQWYGAKCGNSRPLVRHNVIKRIGDYKMSALLSDDVNIVFSAEGVPNTAAMRKNIKTLRQNAANGDYKSRVGTKEHTAFIMDALSSFNSISASRVKLQSLIGRALRDAYITGTGIIYTYWDDSLATGLYADDANTAAIKGDIACENIPVQNVCFGDPTEEDVQKQPYIIIAEKMRREDVLSLIKRFSPGSAAAFTETCEYKDNNVTVLTKLFKETDDSGKVSVYAVRTAAGVTVRKKWNTLLRKYPLSVFLWESRTGGAYGDSEITYLIPNQIAINRMTTAKVWSVMSTGMPLLLVNGDVVDGEITNEPGQVIKIYGTAEDTRDAVKYVSPGADNLGYDDIIEPLIETTLAQNGANAAALGDVDPDNTSAIIRLQNSAKVPLIPLRNRYFTFLEDIAGVWAEFWVMVYGERKLKQEDENGVWYLDYNGADYENLLITAKATQPENMILDSEKTLELLSALYDKGIISAADYLKRLPKGCIKNIGELLLKIKENNNDSN